MRLRVNYVLQVQVPVHGSSKIYSTTIYGGVFQLATKPMNIKLLHKNRLPSKSEIKKKNKKLLEHFSGN